MTSNYDFRDIKIKVNLRVVHLIILVTNVCIAKEFYSDFSINSCAQVLTNTGILQLIT